MEIEFERRAARELERLDRPVQRRILRKLRQIAKRDDPRGMGEPLSANLAGLWKYREGNWRIIVRIEDERFLVLRIGHGSKAYQASV